MHLNKESHKSRLARAMGILRRVEDGVLVALLLGMIGIVVTQIVLRNLFEFGIVWGEILVRILVLWIALVGGMVASRQGKHISIDLIARYLPDRAKSIVDSAVSIFTAVVCALAAYYSLRFVHAEFQDGFMAFAWVPVWICEAIIPFGFGVIALRFLISSFVNLTQAVKPAS
jgi:TRAP-type C4-dicarboxylate transport system permease small subunit